MSVIPRLIVMILRVNPTTGFCICIVSSGASRQSLFVGMFLSFALVNVDPRRKQQSELSGDHAAIWMNARLATIEGRHGRHQKRSPFVVSHTATRILGRQYHNRKPRHVTRPSSCQGTCIVLETSSPPIIISIPTKNVPSAFYK